MDGIEEKGGVPSRLIKTPPEGRERKARHGRCSYAPIAQENEKVTLALDELAWEGARRMIAAALRAVADACVERFGDELGEDGHRLVVRNGRARERRVTIGSGTIPVRAPRVNDKRVEEETGERQRFSSRILPAYARRSPKGRRSDPDLVSQGACRPGDFRPALESLLGEDAAGLSASTVSRLCKEWEAHHDRFRQRLLSFSRYAYLFMDGIHVQVRVGEDPKLCLLIVIGAGEGPARDRVTEAPWRIHRPDLRRSRYLGEREAATSAASGSSGIGVCLST